MFKLTVVNGAARGTQYPVGQGETSIGRMTGNDIVLSSHKVSKKHCVLVIDNENVTVKDAGSSNGTFVNGMLTKLKALKPGDRVSVGEYVLELSSDSGGKLAEAAFPSNVVPLHGSVLGIGGAMPLTGVAALPAGASQSMAGVPAAAVPPQNWQEKIKFAFEKYILNFLYNLNEKHEWNVIMAGLFVSLVVLSSIFSVYPVLDRVSDKLAAEAEGRAFVLARQIVERNTPFIYEKMESKADVSFIEKEPGVLSAYLVDMEGRILAPGRKLNQYITEPNEAAFSALARDAFYKKESLERRSKVFGDMIGVAVPLRIFSASAGKNVPVALGIVFFDRSQVFFDGGTEALAYIQAIILSAIVGVIAYFALYRLTLRPLLALNEDIDQVLKGAASGVNKKFKMHELDSLIDVVNAALQRASLSGGDGAMASAASSEETIAMLKFSADRMSGAGMMIFSGERKIIHVSAFFEEISGIRNEAAVGSDVNGAARDDAFVSFVDDILARAPSAPMEPIMEEFEFSGTNYKMECLAYGQAGAVKAYALTASKIG